MENVVADSTVTGSDPSGGDGLRIHWFLPTGGDSREILPTGESAHRRPPSHEYLTQVATACDTLGYDAVLTPCGTACEDAWLATASLIPATQRLRFLVAFRPGLLSPTLAAQMASTYQRMSAGRLLVNVVIGAEDAELARFGDFSPKDERYERAGEFLTVMRGAWTDEPFDFKGEHYEVIGASTRVPPSPRPGIYFGGASAAAEAVAAEHADVYLAWGETPDMLRERLERMRRLAADAGRGPERPLRFGIRFHVITRETEEEAWAEAGRLLSGIDPEAVAAARADFGSTRSEGQRRMAQMSNGVDFAPSDPRALEVHPNVWAGVGLVRGGAGTALVGSHAQVADRIEEYREVGFEEFILSGYPHLEEAYATGEGLLPELARRGLLPGRSAAPAEPVSSFR
jgi:alkanesulfonate monooxygenase